MATQVAVPTNGGSVAHGRRCQCKNGGGIYKQYYRTEVEAEAAAKRINDDHPDQPEQRPYLCEEGGVYHLTSKPTGTVVKAPGSLRVNTRLHAAQKVAEAAGVEARTRRQYPESVKLEAIRLHFVEGKTGVEIAEKLDISTPALIYNWAQNDELKAKYEKGKVPVSIEQFETEEQKLERQLADLRAKKQAAIEAKKWKFVPCWDGKGVLLSKEGNQIGVRLEDAEELVILLDDYLKAHNTK